MILWMKEDTEMDGWDDSVDEGSFGRSKVEDDDDEVTDSVQRDPPKEKANDKDGWNNEEGWDNDSWNEDGWDDLEAEAATKPSNFDLKHQKKQARTTKSD